MATVEVVAGTPLAAALQNAIQLYLVEKGWSTGGLDDSALSEYILLLLANGQTQDQIATEMSTDLLSLNADDKSATVFAQWLFDQVQILSGHSESNGEGMETEIAVQPSRPDAVTIGAKDSQPSGDVAMEEDLSVAANGSGIPTGPKSMRDGPRASGHGRMLGQLNRAMDRAPDATLHRIKGTAGIGRINSHPPKGPTPKGPRSQINRAALQNAQPQMVQSMPMAPMMANNPMAAMTPQQQMALFKIYEEQARMMVQALTPQQQQQMMQSFIPGMAQAPHFPQSENAGKSLFERVETPSHKSNGFAYHPQTSNGRTSLKADATPFESNQSDHNGAEPDSSMEIEPNSQPTTKSDPTTTLCYFNLSCTNPGCHFVHQSPAAPPGTTIDMTDTCSFGAACKNRKCVGKHPSPSTLGPQRAQLDCKFYPNCTNPACPFRHPATKPCRNGADCAVPDCSYSHNKTMCRYNPCLNAACPFKHAEGQTRGNFEDRVWIHQDEGGESGNSNQHEHVSDRKFVEDGTEEELIRPVEMAEAAHEEGIIA